MTLGIEELIEDLLRMKVSSEVFSSIMQRGSWFKLNEIDNPKITNFTSATNNMAYGRAFFITAKGYMGLGNPQVGDEIWVLFGGDLPFILRPEQDYLSYVLVGDCFVDGIMDGEAMLDLERKKRTVTLR